MYDTTFGARPTGLTVTPQFAPIPGREAEQVQNRAGGQTFKIDCFAQLKRFLILGSASPTYYATAREMTLDNAVAIVECLKADGMRAVAEIVAVSISGRAPKQSPALFALAMASAFGTSAGRWTAADANSIRRDLITAKTENAADVRRAAFEALPKVARTASHLMEFVRYMESVRGWGRGARRAVGGWFTQMPIDKLELQAVKYRQREGWSLRDLLRLSSPSIPLTDADRRLLVEWIVDRTATLEEIERHEGYVADKAAAPRRHAARPGATVIAEARKRFVLVDGYQTALDAQAAVVAGETVSTMRGAVVRAIKDTAIPFECVPTEFLTEIAVWDALLENMPMTNMLRNLGRMTSIDLLKQGNEATAHVVRQLTDEERLRQARIHPYSILVALMTYRQGRATLGKLSWTPIPAITNALNDAFHLAFKTVIPSGKRFMLGIDISGSMDTGFIAGGTDRFGHPAPGPVSARAAAAAMAMVTSATEPMCHAFGFTAGGPAHWSIANGRKIAWGSSENGLTPIDLSKRRRLDDVMKEMKAMSMGATDCALPILYATREKIPVDVFAIYTDNETWAGEIHAAEALRRYRKAMGIDARMVAVAFTATSYSIADPKDAGMLDVVGFDADGPALISAFASGEFGG